MARPHNGKEWGPAMTKVIVQHHVADYDRWFPAHGA